MEISVPFSGGKHVSATMLQRLVPAASGLVLGTAIVVDMLDVGDHLETLTRGEVRVRLALGAAAGATLAAALDVTIRVRVLGRMLSHLPDLRVQIARRHTLAYAAFLLYGVALLALRNLSFGFAAIPVVAFALLHLPVVAALAGDSEDFYASRVWLATLFFLSGVAALIYQVTWQRSLFAAFGVNIESVTVVVTVFMLGLGAGSLLGGWLCRRAPHSIPTLFLACESLIGLFGLVSLPLIHIVGAAAVQSGPFTVTLALFALLLPATVMMGATLPLLVEYLHEAWRNIGRTVGLLYFVNTLGSATACFLTTEVLFMIGGQSASTAFAACCNFTVGFLVFRYMRRIASQRITR